MSTTDASDSQSTPSVTWDGQTNTFFVVLPTPDGVVEAQWTTPLTYVVRIKEADSDEWSVGFETPLTGCQFVGLRPDTEYDFEVRAKNEHGESDPAITRIRTDPEGNIDPMNDNFSWPTGWE